MHGIVENSLYKQVTRLKDKLMVGTKTSKRKIGQDGEVNK